MRTRWAICIPPLCLALSACDGGEQLIELSNENHELKQEVVDLGNRLSHKQKELDGLLERMAKPQAVELQKTSDAGVNPEVDAAWVQFNRAAQELADVRNDLIQKSEQLSLQGDEQVKLKARLADNAEALSEALGALGQANARVMAAERETARLQDGQQQEAEPSGALLHSAREIAQAFQERLKAALQMGIQAGGPAGAIEVCQLQAGPIAQALSDERGWEVGRVSLKLRNPANQPNAWESRVLEELDRLVKSDASATLEANRVEDGRFYFMSGIKTAEICLACHGEAIAADVQARIKALYPEDQATGYALGDLRGAFTFSVSMLPAGDE